MVGQIESGLTKVYCK